MLFCFPFNCSRIRPNTISSTWTHTLELPGSDSVRIRSINDYNQLVYRRAVAVGDSFLQNINFCIAQKFAKIQAANFRSAHNRNVNIN